MGVTRADDPTSTVAVERHRNPRGKLYISTSNFYVSGFLLPVFTNNGLTPESHQRFPTLTTARRHGRFDGHRAWRADRQFPPPTFSDNV